MSNSPSLDDLLAVAVRACAAAARHAVANRHRRREIDKTEEHDVKLRLDRECQDRIEEVVRSAYAGHDVLGEEGEAHTDGADWLWVVDPIDGTVNFLHGLPLWGIAVAVRRKGITQVGAVCLPDLNEQYTATIEKPAQLNGQPIRVSDTTRLADSLVLSGISRHVDKDMDFNNYRELARRTRKLRGLGSASVECCMVAAGRADAYYEASLSVWDWAAGGLIIEQAGGRIEVMPGTDPQHERFLGSNGTIHEAVKSVVGA